MDSVYDNLTLTMQKKTDRIQTLKKVISNLTYQINFTWGLISILILLIYVNFNSYIRYAESIFNNTFSINRNGVTESLNTFEIFVIMALILSGIYIYITKSKRKKINQKYESLRLDIINSLDNEFCYHYQSCSCKDDYIRAMDEYDIDLVFK